MALDKDTRKRAEASTRKSLSILRKAGLYNPKNARKTPTNYAKRLLRKENLQSVIYGKADTVKVPRSVAADYRQRGFEVRNNRVVVSRDGFKTKPRYNKKEKEIVKYSETEILRPLKNINSVNDLPPLKKNQFYAIPFKRGHIIEFQNRTELSDIIALIDDYEKRSTNPYKDILKYIHIGTKKKRKIVSE